MCKIVVTAQHVGAHPDLDDLLVRDGSVYLSKSAVRLFLTHMDDRDGVDGGQTGSLFVRPNGDVFATDGHTLALARVSTFAVTLREMSMSATHLALSFKEMGPHSVLVLTPEGRARCTARVLHRVGGQKGEMAFGDGIGTRCAAAWGTPPAYEAIIRPPKKPTYRAGESVALEARYLARAAGCLRPIASYRTTTKKGTLVTLGRILTRVYGPLDGVHLSTENGKWLVVVMPVCV